MGSEAGRGIVAASQSRAVKGLLALATVGLLLAGCSSRAPRASPPAGNVSPSSSPSPSPSFSFSPPSPLPSPSPTTPRLGKTQETYFGSKVTVYSWNTHVQWPISPKPGKEFSQIDAKVCTGKDADPHDAVEWADSFSLEMPNGTDISSEHIGFNGDEMMVSNRTVRPGQCIRGLVIFENPKAKPRYVLFDATGITLTWKL